MAVEAHRFTYTPTATRSSATVESAEHPNFETNQKLICDSLLVFNTNLPPIVHRFQVTSYVVVVVVVVVVVLSWVKAEPLYG